MGVGRRAAWQTREGAGVQVRGTSEPSGRGRGGGVRVRVVGSRGCGETGFGGQGWFGGRVVGRQGLGLGPGVSQARAGLGLH